LKRVASDAQTPQRRPGALRLIAQALQSRRTAAVTLLGFSSGLPLGLVWIAIPDWLRSTGADIRTVGLITLTQAPWTFKVLWAPLMDRFSLPWLGRRRGWAALAQVALLVLTMVLGGVGDRPEAPWIVLALALAIAFASASQDIAIDAYSVDVLRPEEQGVAVGASRAVYRAAMYLAGGLAITIAGQYSWPLVCAGLALLYLPMLVVTWWAPEPDERPHAPKTLRDAVWLPFLGFLGRHRALEILAFVFCYKIADNLALALLRPFLIDKGYTDVERGVMLATLSAFFTVAGTLLGGVLTTGMGLGRSLWLFGFLQIFSNVGYVLVARASHNPELMYAASAFETATSGMGTGAFSVLLLRITQKRFSATQYALFSSLFGIPRIVSGPIAGFTVNAIGWEWFFWGTILAGIPGMILLHRFSPLGVRDPVFTIEPTRDRPPLSAVALAWRGVLGGAVGLGFGALCLACVAALKAIRATPGVPFDLTGQLAALVQPADAGGWLRLAGLLVFAGFIGLCTAGAAAARQSAAADPGGEQADVRASA
jgi:PAT family beta-lactamase induction signal transducer AmpG